jgi:hypothetical protein
MKIARLQSSKWMVFNVLTLLGSAILTNASTAGTTDPSMPGLVVNNGLAQDIAIAAAKKSKVYVGSLSWEDMGMQRYASSTGGHGDYAMNHINTLRALRSGALKIPKIPGDMTDNSSGILSFDDLSRLIISNAYSRTIFYTIPNQYRPFYKAYWGAYGDAGRPQYPYNYHLPNFPKLPNDNENGTVTINGYIMNASDMQHWQYNYAYALAQPEFAGKNYISVPSIKDAKGNPISLDVSFLAQQFMRQEAMSAAGQLRVILPEKQALASWTSGAKTCANMYHERATARVLSTLNRAYKIKSIAPEDANTAMEFVKQIVIPCYLDKAPAAHLDDTTVHPLDVIPPFPANSAYFSGWGMALMVPALYEAAKTLEGGANDEQAKKLMDIAKIKARWVNEMMSQHKSNKGTPAMPYSVSIQNSLNFSNGDGSSGLSNADGTPVQSLAAGFASGQITAHYSNYGNDYFPGYATWSYTALRIAQEFGIAGAKENADIILATAKQCILKHTGDLCSWNAERSILGFIVEPDGSSKLVDTQGKYIP